MIVINRIIGTVMVAISLYFFYWTVLILATNGGAMGYGYLVLPFSLSVNIFIIPGYYLLKKGESKGWGLKAANLFGIAWGIMWLLFFLK